MVELTTIVDYGLQKNIILYISSLTNKYVGTLNKLLSTAYMMNICLTRLLRNSMRIESTLSVIVGMIIIYSQGSISVKKLYISLTVFITIAITITIVTNGKKKPISNQAL
jgi:hypothetical protein